MAPLKQLFWSGAASWSSRILYAASQDDTLGQDNEFFSISILLYDLFTFFSFYKILKNSNCGALLFFVFYTCAKNIVVLII